MGSTRLDCGSTSLATPRPHSSGQTNLVSSGQSQVKSLLEADRSACSNRKYLLLSRRPGLQLRVPRKSYLIRPDCRAKLGCSTNTKIPRESGSRESDSSNSCNSYRSSEDHRDTMPNFLVLCLMDRYECEYRII